MHWRFLSILKSLRTAAALRSNNTIAGRNVKDINIVTSILLYSSGCDVRSTRRVPAGNGGKNSLENRIRRLQTTRIHTHTSYARRDAPGAGRQPSVDACSGSLSARGTRVLRAGRGGGGFFHARFSVPGSSGSSVRAKKTKRKGEREKNNKKTV